MQSILSLLASGKSIEEIADLYALLSGTGTFALIGGGFLFVLSAMIRFFSNRPGLARLLTFLSIAALLFAAVSLPTSDGLASMIMNY